MQPFTSLESVAAPLPEADVDTDVIFPARFLLLLDKAGLGRHLFHERRSQNGASTDFVLNRPPFDRAQILVAGANFGSGSSREQAVWALADFGIRCVIAPSFGEILRQLLQERRPTPCSARARARSGDVRRRSRTADQGGSGDAAAQPARPPGTA